MKRALEVTKEFRIHNRFDLEVRDGRTGKIRQRAYAENIILASLWTRLIRANSTNYFAYIHFGTGTGTLAASRTSLFAHLGTKAAGNAVFSNRITDGYVSYRKSIQLLENEYIGQFLSEVGIAYSSSPSELVTHALLRDMNGNPTVIEKTSTDIITIYATIYLRMPLAGWESGGLKAYFQAVGKPTDSLIDALGYSLLGENVDHQYDRMFFTAGIPPCITGANNGNNPYYSRTYVSIAPTITYDVANKKMTFYARCPAASGNNVDDINSVNLFGGAVYNYSYKYLMLFADLTNPDVYAGTPIIGEALGVGDGIKKDFRTAFPRVNSAVVKVDGAVASGVTIDAIKPATTDITSFMRVLDFDPIQDYAGRTGGTFPGAIGASEKDRGCIFENPLYATFGIEGLYFRGGVLYCSDDLENWTNVGLVEQQYSANYAAINASFRNKRYWKYKSQNYASEMYQFTTLNPTPENVHFATPPAAGEVVTIDYTTPGAGKDANHVFDFSFVLQLGEYTP